MSNISSLGPGAPHTPDLDLAAWHAIRGQLLSYAARRLARGDQERQHDFVNDGLLAIAEALDSGELDPQQPHVVQFAVNRGRSRMVDSYRREARLRTQFALVTNYDTPAFGVDGEELDLYDTRECIEVGEDPLALLLKACDAEAIHKLLAQLPPQDQALMSAIFVNGRSSADVAREHGVSRAAVNQRKLRVLRDLRGRLEGIFVGPN